MKIQDIAVLSRGDTDEVITLTGHENGRDTFFEYTDQIECMIERTRVFAPLKPAAVLELAKWLNGRVAELVANGSLEAEDIDTEKDHLEMMVRAACQDHSRGSCYGCSIEDECRPNKLPANEWTGTTTECAAMYRKYLNDAADEMKKVED